MLPPEITDTESPEDRDKARASIIGASEWPALLSIPPFGCERNLGYRKLGIKADFPASETGPMRRGHRLEPLIGEEYSLRTGRTLRRPSSPPRADLPDWWAVQPDFTVLKERGLVEAKSTNPWAYQHAVVNGREDWAIQAQAQLARYGRHWCDIAVLEPVAWRLHIIRVELDPAMVAMMRFAGEAFWQKIRDNKLPERLPSDDSRCKACRWRMTCQGEEPEVDESAEVPAVEVPQITDPEFEALVASRQGVKEIEKEAKKLAESYSAKIKTKLGTYGVVELPNLRRRLHFTHESRRHVDYDLIESKYPEAARECITDRSFDKLRVTSY